MFVCFRKHKKHKRRKSENGEEKKPARDPKLNGSGTIDIDTPSSSASVKIEKDADSDLEVIIEDEVDLDLDELMRQKVCIVKLISLISVPSMYHARILLALV